MIRFRFAFAIAGFFGLFLLVAASSATFASEPPGEARKPRRAFHGGANTTRDRSRAELLRPRRSSVSLGATGAPVLGADKALSPERARALAARVEGPGEGDVPVRDDDAKQAAPAKLSRFSDRLALHAAGTLPEEGIQDLARQQAELENLEGLALKGKHGAACYRPPWTGPPSREPESLNAPEGFLADPTKTNTGWILDQHLFDPEAPRTWPTLIPDFKNYDEGQNDITIGHSDHPTPDSMFGWMWQVHSFYWTQCATSVDPIPPIPDHANPSYCLFIYVSGDGGSTWYLYGIVYDPTSADHPVSLDMINPKMAMDITGTYDRFFIAYELVHDTSDHDIYVYSETSELDGGTADPQTAAIATSTRMERNPAIASDYSTEETSYRVVAYEYAYLPSDYDIRARQSTGDGSETHPLLNPGFENGHVNWTENPSNGIISAGDSHTGTYKALLGGSDDSTMHIYQQIDVPSGHAYAALSLYLKITTEETSTTTDYDTFTLKIQNAAGVDQVILAEYGNTDSGTFSGYRAVAFDISAYIGQTIRVYMESETDSSAITSFFVDDVDINCSQWTKSVAVAMSTGSETHPALTAGCTGNEDEGYTAYMHLAYNYEAYQQLLLNAGFESGDDGSWQRRDAADISCSGLNTHSGNCKALLGSSTSQYNDWIYQQVAVPADRNAMQLVFWLKMASDEGTSTAYDYLTIEVRTGSGVFLETLDVIDNTMQDDFASYDFLEYDLSEYVGQTIRIHLWAYNDSWDLTTFYVDDFALTASPVLATSLIGYANAAHPGTAYPTGLANFTKLAVLETSGTPAWPYGPPAIAASHGGSETIPEGRVLVAADQYFPQDEPDPDDPARYQITYAVNMCNGGTGCGDISGCSPAVSYDWNAYFWHDASGDYRYPSMIVDGVGWVEGSSGYPQNGVEYWPEIFMAYYYRDRKSDSLFGGVQMDVTFASEETCSGFQSSDWYYFTASQKASDDDERVVAKPGTIAAFNYFGGWPGIVFNKNIYHAGATFNDDPYFTTPGDNYIIDTTAAGVHIDAYWFFNEVSYLGPWTFPWPAGMEWQILANPDAVSDGRYYTFSGWSTGEPSTTVTIASDWCSPKPPCPETNIDAYYTGGCLFDPPGVAGLVGTKEGAGVKLDWDAPSQPGDVGLYTIYRATDCSSVGNYTSQGTSATTTFTDNNAPGSLYFYLVVAGCGPSEGPWDAYEQ